MNFLAHLYLSGEDVEILLGNFMGDFVNNRQLAGLPDRVRLGVRLHRSIDAFTDTHPEVLSGKRRLYEKHSKYAPVLIDIYYDYLLASHWDDYASEPFEIFVHRMYRLLESHLDQFPERLQELLPRMIQDDWLLRYREYEGLRTTFRYLGRRVSQPRWLEGAVDSLIRSEDSFLQEFRIFFPDLIGHVQRQLAGDATPRNGKRS